MKFGSTPTLTWLLIFMSYHSSPQWPSQGSSGSVAPQSMPTKQGIAEFRDSMESCVSEKEIASQQTRRSFSFFTWLRKHKFKLFPHWRLRFSRRKSRYSQRRFQKEKAVESIQHDRAIRLDMEDSDLIELLTLLAQNASSHLTRENIARKLIEKLSTPVQKLVKQHCGFEEKNQGSLRLDSDFFKKIQHCFQFIAETRNSLQQKQLSQDDQLAILKKMVDEVIYLSSKACLELLNIEFWSLFEELYSKSKERIVRAFFDYIHVDEWSNYLDEMMIKSHNPFKLKVLFDRHAGEKERDLTTPKVIKAEIEQLAKENKQALDQIRLDYYYTNALSKEVYHRIKESSQENPQRLSLLLGIALYRSFRLVKETLEAIEQRKYLANQLTALLQYNQEWYQIFISTCAQGLRQPSLADIFAWKGYQYDVSPIIQKLLNYGENFLSQVAGACLSDS